MVLRVPLARLARVVIELPASCRRANPGGDGSLDGARVRRAAQRLAPQLCPAHDVADPAELHILALQKGVVREVRLVGVADTRDLPVELDPKTFSERAVV